MTTEEKAKAYDEALERAKKFAIDDAYASQGVVAKLIFPELRESENERVRKAIIELIHRTPSGAFESNAEFGFVGATHNEMLAYLEKLKEQKPCEDSGTGGDIMQYIEEGKKRGIKEVISFPEKYGLQKRQKPAEWSEEDEKIIDTIVPILGQYIDYKAVSGTGSGYAIPRYSKEIDWLKSLRPQLHWKPSEEQMKALNAMNCYGELSYQGQQQLLIDLYQQLKKL